MRGLGAAAAALSLLAAPAGAREAEAFGRLPEPRATTGPGGAPAQVLDLGRGAVLTASADEGEGDRARYEVRVDGTRVDTWTMAWGDASRTLLGFRQGDDVVVGTRTATSMGMGVEAWTIVAFRLRGSEPLAPPLRFFATDWGPDAVRATVRGMQVLATDWVSPTHGPGRASLHFMGAWFSVGDGRLGYREGWVARPYLFGFERERGKRRGAQPAAWLRAARPYPGGDPRMGPSSARILSGRLEATRQGLTLGGRPLWFGEGEAPAGAMAVDHVDDRRMIYPRHYQPANPGAWARPRAEVRQYGDRRFLVLR